MAAAGEEELICDFAQCYHVLDWRGLPLKTAAVLAAGLPEDARIRKKMSGRTCGIDTLILAQIVDLLRWFQWARTEDGRKGQNHPESLFLKLAEPPAEKKDPGGFRTPEDFMAAYKKATGEDFVIGPQPGEESK